jgi:hypothetical protein
MSRTTQSEINRRFEEAETLSRRLRNQAVRDRLMVFSDAGIHPCDVAHLLIALRSGDDRQKLLGRATLRGRVFAARLSAQQIREWAGDVTDEVAASYGVKMCAVTLANKFDRLAQEVKGE